MPKVIAQLHSRPPLERMMRIHEQIRTGRFPNCSSLAKEVEVSSRTIKRDVDFMKYRLDMPIEYNARRYGYYYSAKVEHFPTMPVRKLKSSACWWRRRRLRSTAARRLSICWKRPSGN